VNKRLPYLNLPEVSVKMKSDGDLIFDPVRKKWLKLTPEEWVRQNLIMYLNMHLHYPLSLMETEKQIKLFNTVKRADIVLNDASLKPIIIVECKSTNIKIDQGVFDQAIRYHMGVGVQYLFISNGIKHYAIKLDPETPIFLDKLPDYREFLTHKVERKR
jgi:hypothetical protein